MSKLYTLNPIDQARAHAVISAAITTFDSLPRDEQEDQVSGDSEYAVYLGTILTENARANVREMIAACESMVTFDLYTLALRFTSFDNHPLRAILLALAIDEGIIENTSDLFDALVIHDPELDPSYRGAWANDNDDYAYSLLDRVYTDVANAVNTQRSTHPDPRAQHVTIFYGWQDGYCELASYDEEMIPDDESDEGE